MSELSKILYKEMILDHNKNPRHFGELKVYTDLQVGNNASCGDKLALYVEIKDDIILNISFTGEGCAIFKSSASLLLEATIGKTKKEALDIIETFEMMILKPDTQNTDWESKIGKLSTFVGVKQYPARVKCALLAYRTLESILKGQNKEITTEE